MSVAFLVKASNGYSISFLAGSKRADGQGDALLFLRRGHSGAIYGMRATVTADSVRADLGALGRIDMVAVPTVRTKVLRGCGERVEVPATAYEGTFEFRGENGYTEASATRLPGREDFFVRIVCGDALTEGESWGPDDPGARLVVRADGGGEDPLLRVRKKGPRARTSIEVAVEERRQGMRIRRSTSMLVGAAAFDYDPRLRFASVAPPAPFSGRATFRRDSAPAGRWTGNLAVDLPGRPNLRLTGQRLTARIAHVRWSRSVSRGKASAAGVLGLRHLGFPAWPTRKP